MSDPLPLYGLHHLARTTRNVEASVAFYSDVLGFRAIPRPAFDFRGAWLFGYGLQIHLIERTDLPAPDGPINSRVDHLAFTAPDLDEVERRLRARGIEYAVRHQANNPARKQIFFRDPDGQHLEVGAYGPRATDESAQES